tara:strand:- start:667 stop:840 length:174 start_codon:yes stop_codon:yes gene_type:complete
MSPQLKPKELINVGYSLKDRPNDVRLFSTGDVTRTIESSDQTRRNRVFSESDLKQKQ